MCASAAFFSSLPAMTSEYDAEHENSFGLFGKKRLNIKSKQKEVNVFSALPNAEPGDLPQCLEDTKSLT